MKNELSESGTKGSRLRVNNINQAVFTEMKREFLRHAEWSLVMVVFLLVLIIFFSFYGIFIAGIVLVLWYSRVAIRARSIFWREVAASKGWQFVGEGEIADEKALFLNVGTNRCLHSMVTGTYQGLPVRTFESSYRTGNGNNKTTYFFSGFMFRYQGNFPHLYLNRRGNYVSFISNPLYQISLPDSFSEKFTLYAPKEYELEALQVFTPDLFHYLLTVDWPYDVEFVNQEIIIIRQGYVNSLSEFEQELAKANDIALRFKSNLQHMRFSTIPQTPHLLKASSNVFFGHRGSFILGWMGTFLVMLLGAILASLMLVL